MVHRVLNHPQLRVAFFIDPWVSDSLQGKAAAQVVYLMDPVKLPEHHPTPAQKTAIRARLGVPDTRKLFLLFGDITPRKGLWTLIHALQKLTPEEEARMCLAIVGHAEPDLEKQLAAELETLAAGTQLAVIRRASYVDDVEMANWFTGADVVMLPYLNHAGMSGVQLIAAAHRRPVISQAFGPMGRLTREYQLGLTTEPSDPVALAGAMRRFLGEGPSPGFDPKVAYALAKQQSHEKFAETLLRALGPYTT
jgi:glycosyltransferase involved in cell wall biosynthesis